MTVPPMQNDAEDLLLRLHELVETARSMPMSASAMVNREEFLTLIDDALNGLPEELRQARWILKDREEVLSKARREADEIIEAARLQAARMVERTEVVREANRIAQERLDEADAAARAMRHEAEDYVDQKLAGFEVILERIMQAVEKGRERLQPAVPPEPGPPVDDAELDEAAFFDQDER